MRPYNIGITIYVGANGELGLYENGLRQNVLFLRNMFAASPLCKRVYLLNHGDGELGDIPVGVPLAREDIVRTPALTEHLDYVIVLGAAMDEPSVRKLRAQGTKIISYKGGNGIVISMEAIIARPPRNDAERYFDRDFFDAIWMTPQHLHTYKSYCETIYRCPVFEVPQVWQPLFLEARIAALTQPFGYQRATPDAPRKRRIGILDPNITVMKTSHMPLLVCEAAFRQRPELFQAIYTTNAIQFMQNQHFVSFANKLEIFKSKVATVEPRFVTADFLANHADAVVTHHWENGLNYLYYDVLYGGYPLIHNSEFLRDVGYYYDSFDAESGGNALLQALTEHDHNFDAYQQQCQRLLQRVSATDERNIAHHEALLAACP